MQSLARKPKTLVEPAKALHPTVQAPKKKPGRFAPFFLPKSEASQTFITPMTPRHLALTLPFLLSSSLSALTIAPVRINGSTVEVQNIPSEVLAQMQQQGTRPSGSSSQKTPEQTRTQLLQKLVINRTTSGILEARLAAKRLAEKGDEKGAEEPKPADPPKDAPKPNPAQLKQKENQAKLKQFQEDVQTLRRDVVLGNWSSVKDALEKLPDNDAKVAFSRIVQQLGSKAQVNPRPELATLGAKGHSQAQYLRPGEILALSDAAKKAPDQNTLTLLAKLIGSAQKMPTAFFDALKTGTRYFGTKDEETKHRTAELLITASMLDEVPPFLPDLEKAKEEKKYPSLNLLARFHAESHSAEKGKEHLPQAWGLSLEIIGEKKAPLNEKGIALYRALSLVPELEGSTGKDWLTKTFSDAEGEGFEILAAVGTLAAQTREHASPDFRLEQLKLQSAAAAALLGNEEVDLTDWKEVLTLYVRNWNAEANRTKRLDTSTSLRPQSNYDPFGNIYYGRRPQQTFSRNVTPPIDSGDLLRTRPDDKWLANIDEPVRLDNLGVSASLFLKVKEETQAFPLLKELASHRPEATEGLVREMIQVWAENNNPNQQSRYRSSYFYYSGYNQRAETIPLTRSKQERNLRKLAEFVTEVRGLALEDNFEDEFSDAFIQAHSQAEVWRVESLESVFGPVDELDPDTIASLLRRMRTNLARLWPNPKIQEQAKTKRKDKELEAQVLRGYAAATQLCDDALEKHRESWALEIQKASLSYERSNYQSKIASYPEHSANKRFALDDLADAAAKYAATLPLEDEKDESEEPFTTWFYASLGSPDLGALKADDQPVPSELAKIKAALDALPGEAKKRHLDSFAKTINARLANVSADLKYRFLEAALPITGEHERIEEASKVYQYYQDLVTEIQLDTYVDGPDRLTSTEPFGLFVNLRHTKEIERESGGFQRYLINQNNSRYSYNYGRPTEDYRDKFEKGARAVLAEHFEIVSITFHSSKVAARTDTEPGWTVTPYAYFLLKPKGPEIDSIPPLKIDLDFLDTSGYVVLPISSAAIPIDASKIASTRPFRDLSLTMILDERESETENKIYLEIRAQAHGLIPSLEELVKLEFDDLTVSDTEDRELQIEELDATTDDGAPLSTHEWRLTLAPKGDHLPTSFTFPALLVEVSEKEDEGLLRQRYDDVDLVEVDNTTEIIAGEESQSWLAWIIAAALLIIAGTLFLLLRKKTEEEIITGPALPSTLTPVTLLTFLENIQKNTSLGDSEKEELKTSIITLKDRSFGPAANPPENDEIHAIAKQWQQAATPKKAA